MKSYRDLDIWKKGVVIVNKMYKVTADFPKEELYGLTTQMRRSATSIPANIAEGFARQHNREYKQFLYIALGSCAELETQLIVSYNQHFISQSVYQEMLEYLDHESRMLMSLIKVVSRSLS
jgi:four helix bundle protein